MLNVVLKIAKNEHVTPKNQMSEITSKLSEITLKRMSIQLRFILEEKHDKPKGNNEKLQFVLKIWHFKLKRLMLKSNSAPNLVAFPYTHFALHHEKRTEILSEMHFAILLSRLMGEKLLQSTMYICLFPLIHFSYAQFHRQPFPVSQIKFLIHSFWFFLASDAIWCLRAFHLWIVHHLWIPFKKHIRECLDFEWNKSFITFVMTFRTSLSNNKNERQ